MNINHIAFIVLLSFGILSYLYLLVCEKDKAQKDN